MNLTLFVYSISHQVVKFCHFNRLNNPERDSNLGPSGIAVIENCQATALTTQPPRLLYKISNRHHNSDNNHRKGTKRQQLLPQSNSTKPDRFLFLLKPKVQKSICSMGGGGG